MKQCCFSSNSSSPGDVVLYEGPANAQILRFKRIAVGTLVCFSVIYPACAIGLNIGTATVGLGTRLLLTATGVFYFLLLFLVIYICRVYTYILMKRSPHKTHLPQIEITTYIIDYVALEICFKCKIFENLL